VIACFVCLHAAAIVGARNGGAGGIVGVAPGVGIFSTKILDAQGVGEGFSGGVCAGYHCSTTI
jgi:hypothetical protein